MSTGVSLLYSRFVGPGVNRLAGLCCALTLGAGMAAESAGASVPPSGSVSAGAETAAPQGTTADRRVLLSRQLAQLRSRIIEIEDELLKSLKGGSNGQNDPRARIRRLRELQTLQQREVEISALRMKELERVIARLTERRDELSGRITSHQQRIRQFLIGIDRSSREPPKVFPAPRSESFEAPRRKFLASLVDWSVKEIEALKVDLADADRLEQTIQDEKLQLAALVQEMQEQRGLVEFHKQFQLDLIRKGPGERLGQLERYRELKRSEAKVEGLITEFNARLELEREAASDQRIARAIFEGEFARRKGALPFPIGGKVVAEFGRHLDPNSKLQVFKKGIEIDGGAGKPVKAVSPGKVVYAGQLPGYGRVAILDHGSAYYSLCANLGELKRKMGDLVDSGEVIGMTDPNGKPVYFEVRSRNVPVNPLQWVTSSNTF